MRPYNWEPIGYFQHLLSVEMYIKAGVIVMKSTIKLGVIAAISLQVFVSSGPPVSAQTCSNQSEPLIIYRNAGPPIIIENGFNPCKEYEKKAYKLQRKREKPAQKLEKQAAKKEIRNGLRP